MLSMLVVLLIIAQLCCIWYVNMRVCLLIAHEKNIKPKLFNLCSSWRGSFHTHTHTRRLYQHLAGVNWFQSPVIVVRRLLLARRDFYSTRCDYDNATVMYLTNCCAINQLQMKMKTKKNALNIHLFRISQWAHTEWMVWMYEWNCAADDSSCRFS